MTDRITIPTATVGFSATPNSKKLTPSDCDMDRQPELTIGYRRFGPDPAIFGSRSLSTSDGYWLSIHFNWARRYRKSRICRWNFDAICHSSRGFGGYVDTSGCRSLLYSLVNTIFCLYMVLNSVLERLQRVQNCAVRYILNAPPRLPSRPPPTSQSSLEWLGYPSRTGYTTNYVAWCIKLTATLLPHTCQLWRLRSTAGGGINYVTPRKQRHLANRAFACSCSAIFMELYRFAWQCP